jgi:hypothetical protein
LPKLFEGKKVVSYDVKEELFTGIALAEHKDNNGKIFYVSHLYENERVAHIIANVEEPGGGIVCRHRYIVIICGNGMVWIIAIPEWR